MAEPKQDTYAEQLKEQFRQIIDGLTLDDLQKRFLRDRWLDQLVWFEGKSAHNQRRYYLLRLVIIVGGVTVPALVSLNIRQEEAAQTLAWITFGVSLVVAIAAALEAFFGYGERWRSFRRTAEALKSHGWQFFELAGPYASAGPRDRLPGVRGAGGDARAAGRRGVHRQGRRGPGGSAGCRRSAGSNLSAS